MTPEQIQKMADGLPPSSIGMDHEEVVMWMAKHSIQLQEQVKALAGENVALRKSHPQPFGIEMMKALDAYEKHQDECPETGMLDAFFILRDSIRITSEQTDAFVAEMKASGAAPYIEELPNLAGKFLNAAMNAKGQASATYSLCSHELATLESQLRKQGGE